MRPSWVEVDLDAIRHNVREIGRVIAPARFCAVVKADGYGHGDVPVAEAALEAGADWLAVATVTEAMRLREAGLEAPILLLSEATVSDIGILIANNLTPTVYSEEFLAAIAAAADEPAAVHVKLDTGMHRVGTDETTAAHLVARIQAEPRLRLEGLWTHFPSAEGEPDFTAAQIKQLRDFVDLQETAGSVPDLVHAANSAGALLYPEARFDMVRIGLAMYGCYPSPECREVVMLQPAMRVVSEVVHTKRLPAGARPTYGRIRALEAESTVATVPIGYADGITRRLAKIGGEVLIGGKRRPYAGVVTMDQVVITMGDDPVQAGDEVVLLGRQGEEEIDADEWANRLDSVSWEVLCGFGPRLPRRYRG
ncbi:MAG: alanine racemase [Acidimicrobiia bacterium]|nr:alanine racemase [Acidimicrobiia bacterium]